MKNSTKDGYKKLLDCPECGELCKGMLPYQSTPEYPHPWWQDGDTGTCQCGASLIVRADGERAWFEIANDEHDAP